jgi:soluble lytic murein transglycosylase-like protein
MSGAPILRSAALQRALALNPTRRQPAAVQPASFANTLGKTLRRASATTPATEQSVGAGPVPFADLIQTAARRNGVDPALLASLVKHESNFNPGARSGVGAKGLTQLMDATARGLGVADPFDPAQSLEGGAKFLGGLLKQFHGNESLALAAYNAGPAAVQKYGGIPPYQETQRYVPKVLGYAAQLRRIWADSTATHTSPLPPS